MKLYYDILGLNNGASLEEVERACRDLLEVFTKNQISHNPEFRLNAGQKMKEIIVAYNEVKSHLFETMTKTLK